MDASRLHLLSHLPPANPPQGLFERVLEAIRLARIRSLWVRLSLSGSALAACLLLVAGLWADLWTEIGSSSFLDYVRLTVSDPDIVLTNLHDLAFGVLESLPAESLLIALAIAFLVVASFATARMLRDLKRGPHLASLHH